MKKIANGSSVIARMAGAGALMAATAGTALAWETPVFISADGVESYQPDLAVDGKGNAYFSYLANDLPHWRVTVARKPTGGALEPGAPISQTGTSVFTHVLKADKKGSAAVAWIQADGAPETVKVATKDKKSATFGAPVVVEDSGSFNAVVLDLDRKGNTTVIWDDSSTLSGATRPKKGDFAAPFVVSPVGGGYPFLASDKKGNALLLWHGNDGMGGLNIFRSARPAGGVFDAPVAISSGAFDVQPKVAFDKKGNATAIWEGSVGPVWGATITDMPATTFGTFGSPSVVSPTSVSVDPRIAFDRKGNALAVWSRDQGGTARIEVSERPAGGTFGVTTVISNLTRISYAPQVVIDAKGNANVIWASYDGVDYRIETARRPAGGVFGAAEILYEGTEPIGYPKIAVDKKGNLFAAWARAEGVWNRIQGAWELVN